MKQTKASIIKTYKSENKSTKFYLSPKYYLEFIRSRKLSRKEAKQSHHKHISLPK